jgi:antitoxin ParD1/3/4
MKPSDNCWNSENHIRALQLEKLRDDIREGLESGSSIVFDPEEIKRKGRERKAAKKSK